ncbi:MAG: PIN domain-containing protein [Candidatus Kuenenbacteria bacterium]
MTYLIDTNIIIDHLRDEKIATDFLIEIENGNKKGFISVITEYELLASKRIPKNELDSIEKLLSLLPSRSVTSRIVREASYFHRKYDTDIADALIAATAWAGKAILVTRNIKHFKDIKEVKVQNI